MIWWCVPILFAFWKGAREVVQWLRKLAFQRSFRGPPPGSQNLWRLLTVNSSSRGSSALFWPLQALHGTCTYTLASKSTDTCKRINKIIETSLGYMSSFRLFWDIQGDSLADIHCLSYFTFKNLSHASWFTPGIPVLRNLILSHHESEASLSYLDQPFLTETK